MKVLILHKTARLKKNIYEQEIEQKRVLDGSSRSIEPRSSLSFISTCGMSQMRRFLMLFLPSMISWPFPAQDMSQ